MSWVARSRSLEFGAVLALLFGLPFAAAGCFMGWLMWSGIFEYLAMRSWVETPARILKVDLKVVHGEGVSYQVLSEYEYLFAGRTYHGSRVGLHQGSDNVGSFNQRVHEELKGYQSNAQPFRCFVNPQRPSESILYPQLRTEIIAFVDLAVVLFGGFGWAMIFGAIYAWRDQWRRASLETQHPDHPWLWRADWAANEIRPSHQYEPVVVGIALFWNLAAVPLWSLLPIELLNGEVWALLPLCLPAIGLWFAIVGLRAVRDRRLTGRCRLRLKTVPVGIGGPFAGDIQTERRIVCEQFELRMSCTETVKNGEDSKSTEIWSDENLVANKHDVLSDAEEGTVIRVSFEIPGHCRPTTESAILWNNNDGVQWKLILTAPELGSRFRREFLVPVFAKDGTVPG